MAYGGGVYIIKRLAHFVVDAKNDNTGLYLLCDYMTASFCYSIFILSKHIRKIRSHLVFAQNVLKVSQKLIQENGLELSGGYYLSIHVRELDPSQADEDVDDRDSGVHMI